MSNVLNPFSLSTPLTQYASFSVLYMITGKGTLKLQLINMRDNMIVGFFTGGNCKSVFLVDVKNIR